MEKYQEVASQKKRIRRTKTKIKLKGESAIDYRIRCEELKKKNCMGWQHDLGVIEYLTKRLRYYKRKSTWSRNLIVPNIKDNKVSFRVIEKWRERFTIKDIRQATAHYEKRVKEYETAIEILKTK